MLPGYGCGYDPYSSPIYGQVVTPRKAGTSILTVEFCNAVYAARVQDFTKDLHILRRQSSYLVAALVGQDISDRTAIVHQVSGPWLVTCCPQAWATRAWGAARLDRVDNVRDFEESGYVHAARRRASALVLTMLAFLGLGVSVAQADVLGVDTSHWQHPANQPISWTLLPGQGYKWAVMKAVQGSTYTDPSFAQDWAAAGNAGLIRGAYDFANPTSSSTDAVAEARHFIAVTGPLRGRNTLPPVLDLEVSNGLNPTALIAWTQAWIGEARALTGRRPIIYTYANFWQSSMADSTGMRTVRSPVAMAWQASR